VEGTLSQSVLVVDDEPMARQLLRLMLVRAGFEVFEAESGLDALAKVNEKRPDVVLLDVMMPEMDGFTVCQNLRADVNLSGMPIIMLSAKTDAHSVQRGITLGANKYLTKPISPADLVRHVQEVLDPAG
jgi:DNA-binding response OmpR family regulator